MKNILFYLNYLDILIYCFSVLVVIVLILILIKIISIYKVDNEKSSVYECGFEAITNIRHQFDVSYVTIAILYLIFDVEILILLPSILQYQTIFFLMSFFFIVVLLLGFYFEWLRGTLSWL